MTLCNLVGGPADGEVYAVPNGPPPQYYFVLTSGSIDLRVDAPTMFPNARKYIYSLTPPTEYTYEYQGYVADSLTSGV